MATLITGIGLVGTSFAQLALKRSEQLVFFDFQPRAEFLKKKLEGVRVEVVQKDIRDLPALVQAMKDYHIDTVVHTAGLIGNRVTESLYTGLQINVMGTINVAEAVRLTGVKRLVHISTFGVYDWRREMPGPIKESFPLGSSVAYGNSKAAKELLLEAYQRTYGFELIVLRLANVYGLGHFWAGSGGGEKFQTLLVSGLRGDVAKIPQEQTMDFEYIYAKDVGRAIDLVATVRLPERRVFNIGSGKITRFQEVIETIKRLLPGLRTEIMPGKPPASRSQHLDISQAREFLGWTSQYPMEKAFEDYLQDLRIHHDDEIKSSRSGLPS